MKQGRIWYTSLWLTMVLLLIFFGVSLFLRVKLPYSQVFVGDWIKYTTNDAYYFVRQIDNLVHNFPHFLTFDPYQYFPNGFVLNGQNLFVYFVSTVIWIIGLGSPSQHLVDLISVYIPPVLGALTVVPVYFIGKALFNRWAGLISAALIAVAPGEFLGRTILGNTDRDGFEVMLAALTMLFFILAIKSAREKQLSLQSLVPKNISQYWQPLVFSLVVGILIGIYVLTWRGSFLFILTILVYCIVQSVIDHFKGRSTEYLGIIGVTSFLFALVLFLVGSRATLVMAGLVLALLTVLVLSMLAWFLASRKTNPVFYPLGIVAIGAIGIGALYGANHSLFDSIMEQFSVFLPIGTNMSVMQMQPILFPAGQFSWIPVWGNFTTGIFLIFISLGMIIYFTVKKEEPQVIFFLVWSLLMLIATLLTRRMALLFATNVALLTGYLAWQILRFMVNKTASPAAAPVSVTRPVKKKRSREAEPRKAQRGFMAINRIPILVITVIALFFLIFFPEFSPAITAATQTPVYAPSDNWYKALTWLEGNTPRPFGDSAANDNYYKYYSQPVPYPESAYGVAAWWDFGYWIIRIGHRLPVSDPGGGARVEMANLLTAQNEVTANQIMDQLKIKYVIIDDTTITSKFGGVTTYAGLGLEQFGEVYYINNSGKLNPVMYYYPEYFQSLANRLYRYEGQKAVPASILVISYQDKVSREGTPYKEVTSSNTFTKYEDAAAFISKQKTGNYRIVSNSAVQSPVPLDSLSHYKMVYSTGSADPTAVKIFEYIK